MANGTILAHSLRHHTPPFPRMPLGYSSSRAVRRSRWFLVLISCCCCCFRRC
ncbi:EC1118_1N9_2685p [Saccharomyces cerevisiae EC1118]|uniref:Putative uncharacterized protein YNL097W-A n=2 Tax=Saccharomyces cerevisiae TaxID=4932 RepID=YN097_YEAST|nr:RecName: Full=Putative uncharacterized protein YNL097W-A [Saccharomyces cerevisiae S288C]AAL79287.1 unknown [Saccharomyces cerevisiae]CAY82507.1 EC1118_1N9_2685p [Saccharomyces cerevisiae EC1118]